MALIRCSECGNNVSTMARVCPNCGYPVPQTHEKNDKAAQIVLIVRIAALALAIIFTIFACVNFFSSRHDYKMMQAQADRETMAYNWTEQWHEETYGSLDIPSLADNYSGQFQKHLIYSAVFVIFALSGYTVALDFNQKKLHKRVRRDRIK